MDIINYNTDIKDFLLNSQVIEIHSLSNNLIFSRVLNDDDMYMGLEFEDYILIFKDNNYVKYKYFDTIIVFLIIVLILSASYYYTIKKIEPIKDVIKDIKNFADGKINTKNILYGKDEISQVSQSFHQTANKVEKLINSRTLFLRNIMHELKTPITKGRISAEMIEKGKNRDRLIDVFERLELLINEFALIERINSGHIKLDKKEYRLIDIIDHSTDLAMIDFSNISVDVRSDIKLSVNFNLFCIGIKNMIDNAMKYSPDGLIKIATHEEDILFINSGEALKKELKEYLKPFSSQKKDSLGLGLYIVSNILEMHNCELEYDYTDGKNRFHFKNIIKTKRRVKRRATKTPPLKKEVGNA